MARSAKADRFRPGLRKALLISILAILVLLTCTPDTKDSGSPTVSAVFDWTNIPDTPLDLREGWSVGSCGEGDAPFACVRERGTTVGTLELNEFALDSFTLPGFQEALKEGDKQRALEIVVADHYATFKQDRLEGCGPDYTLRTRRPKRAEVGGSPGLRYGFTGSHAGRLVEDHLDHNTIRAGSLAVISAPAYEPGTCLFSDEEIAFRPATLRRFAPRLVELVAKSRLP